MKAPLVLVETNEREEGHAAALAAAMPDRSVHRLPPPGLGDDEILPRVRDWVEAHEKQFHGLGLDGPIVLGGWSFGGVVAIELARSLAERGVEVERVLLMDCSRPRLRPRGAGKALSYYLQEAALLADGERGRAYLKASARSYRAMAAWRLRQRLWRARVIRPVLRRSQGPPPTEQGPRLPNEGAVPTAPLRRSIHRSYLNYRARWVVQPVAMVTAHESARRASADPTLGWAPFLRGGYSLAVLPTTHRGMWEPRDSAATAAAVASVLDG